MAALPKVYLAGKICDVDWRNQLVTGLRGAWGSDGYIGQDFVLGWGAPPPPWPILSGAVLNGRADYTGPYFVGCDHGCSHGRGDHTINGACADPDGTRGHPGFWTVEQCRRAIERSDIVFAYIDAPDCYGTLIELGWASAMKKKVVICFPSSDVPYRKDMWFAQEMAHLTDYGDPAELLARVLPSKHPLIESEAEQRFWDAHERLGDPALTGLVPQHRVGRYRLDFAIPAQRLGVEIDGYKYHSDPDTFVNDRVRHRELERAGWRIVRFSGREACNNPTQCVREAAQAVGTFGPGV